MSLIYKKMSLFDAPKGSILVHACNAKGVWGAGIAKEMKKKFPNAYEHYHIDCLQRNMTSRFDYQYDAGYYIASLVTSKDYGVYVDSPEEILLNTSKALVDFITYVLDNDHPIYSNKFNSGKFHVPWEQTEDILKRFVKAFNVDWIVCE